MTRITYKSFTRLRRKPIPASTLERPKPTPGSIHFISGRKVVWGEAK